MQLNIIYTTLLFSMFNLTMHLSFNAPLDQWIENYYAKRAIINDEEYHRAKLLIDINETFIELYNKFDSNLLVIQAQEVDKFSTIAYCNNYFGTEQNNYYVKYWTPISPEQFFLILNYQINLEIGFRLHIINTEIKERQNLRLAGLEKGINLMTMLILKHCELMQD